MEEEKRVWWKSTITMLYWSTQNWGLSFGSFTIDNLNTACEKWLSYLGQMDEAEDSSPHDYQLPAAWDVQQYVDPI